MQNVMDFGNKTHEIPLDVTDLMRKGEPLRTTEQVCEMLQIKKHTLYSWIKLKGFPVIRFSEREMRFNVTQIGAWIEAQNSQVMQQVSEKGEDAGLEIQGKKRAGGR